MAPQQTTWSLSAARRSTSTGTARYRKSVWNADMYRAVNFGFHRGRGSPAGAGPRGTSPHKRAGAVRTAAAGPACGGRIQRGLAERLAVDSGRAAPRQHPRKQVLGTETGCRSRVCDSAAAPIRATQTR